MAGASAKRSQDLCSAGLFWALVYGVASMAITLFNKAVLTEYEFQFPQVLTVCQGAFTIVAMFLLRAAGVITFGDLNWKVARQVAPLSLVFIFYVVVSLAALGRVNVPMFTALRRTTLLFVMALEYFSSGTVPSRWTMAAAGVMMVGAMIAAAKDLTYDPVSYGFVFLTNLGTALYTVNIASVKREHKLDIFTMLWYNNLMTMPALAILAWWSGEMEAVMNFPHMADTGFLTVFFFSATLALFLNYSTYQSTSLNSPTTQSVIGQLKNFVAFVLSLVLFSDYKFHVVNFGGLLIGFAGGVWYSVMQMQPSPKKAPALPGKAGATAVRDVTASGEDGDNTDDENRGADATEHSMSEGDDHVLGHSHLATDGNTETSARPRLLDSGASSRASSTA